MVRRTPGGALEPVEKEMHAFDSSLVTGFTPEERESYLRLFGTEPHLRPGEFTPYYLRALWIPEVARSVCREDVVLVVLLRDPVERFESAMRHEERRARFPGPEPSKELQAWVNLVGADVQWGGMYASHLEGWASVFDPSRIVVLQYEQVRMNPQGEVEKVWERLGLHSVRLQDVDRQSATSTDRGRPWRWGDLPGLRERLIELYAPEIERCVRSWGIDPSLWPSAGHAVADRRRRWWPRWTS